MAARDTRCSHRSLLTLIPALTLFARSRRLKVGERSRMMTGQIGCLHFDGTADRRWSVPAAQIGGLPIALIDRANSAELMLDAALRRRGSTLPPVIFTSANGQVLSMSARHRWSANCFSQPISFTPTACRWSWSRGCFTNGRCRNASAPPTCSTTSHVWPQSRGARMFSGATKEVIDEAARRIRRLYPALDLAGHASGYMRRAEDEEQVIDLINAARPDILWLGLGIPAEQAFAVRIRNRLRVGLIKTFGRLVRLHFRQKRSRTGLDAACRPRMGFPRLPRAAASRRPLSRDQSSRLVFVAHPHSAWHAKQHAIRRIESSPMIGTVCTP